MLSANLGLDFIQAAQWMHHVNHNLPETDATAWTSIPAYAVDIMAGTAR